SALFLFDQVLIYGFDEHGGSPWTAGGTVTRVVIQSRPRRLDLIEGPALFDQILNAIAHDHQHVPVLEDVSFVTDAPVSGTDVRSTFLQSLRHGNIEQTVHAVDQSLHRSTVLRVNHGVRRRHEHVASNDDIGTAEVNDGVATRVRSGRVVEKDRFVVEEEVL